MLVDQQKLRLAITRKIHGLIAGGYTSVYQSPGGYEIEEKRIFQLSDPPRALDFLVSSRENEPWVRIKNPDRGANVYFSWDLSASHQFNPSGKTKRESMAELGAMLAKACSGEGNQIGMIYHTDILERVESPTADSLFLEEQLRWLSGVLAKSKGTDLKIPLRFLLGQTEEKEQEPDMVFLISDFLCEGFENLLQTLSQSTDCVAIVLQEKAEQELPPLGGVVEMEDLETGQIFYASGLNSFYSNLRDWFKKNSIEGIFLNVSQSLDSNLLKIAEILENPEGRE